MRGKVNVWRFRLTRHLTRALVGTVVLCSWSIADDAVKEGGDRDLVRRGEELFLREWIPDDPRSHGGDGLGPVYNDTSCVGCHNLGAPGGGGPASKNVPIISVLDEPEAVPGFVGAMVTAMKNANRSQPAKGSKEAEANSPTKKAKPDVKELAVFHAGFRSSKSVVLHRYGTATSYEPWRQLLLGEATRNSSSTTERVTKEDLATLEILQVRARTAMSGMSISAPIQRGDFQLILTQRNTPPLFGAGLINAIPDAVLMAAAEKRDPQHPEIKGRVSRLPDGKIGRFGWKGQTSNLKEFVLTACSVELGLEVPGHSQGGLPGAPHYKATGMDLDEAESNALVAYVEDLAPPGVRTGSSRRETNFLQSGKELFQTIGCAHCHVPDLGAVEGLYSDLLLHDMGEALSDAGAYSIFASGLQGQPSDAGESPRDRAADPAGPKAREWRTPPLWGFRDSSPYLHDGRADELAGAVAAHGGEATQSARRFFMLTLKERLKVEGFLKSLTAPVGAKPNAG